MFEGNIHQIKMMVYTFNMFLAKRLLLAVEIFVATLLVVALQC